MPHIGFHKFNIEYFWYKSMHCKCHIFFLLCRRFLLKQSWHHRTEKQNNNHKIATNFVNLEKNCLMACLDYLMHTIQCTSNFAYIKLLYISAGQLLKWCAVIGSKAHEFCLICYQKNKSELLTVNRGCL